MRPVQAGQMPIVSAILRHNPVLLWLERHGWYHGNTFPGADLALERIKERQKRYESTDPAEDSGGEDFLDKFMMDGKEHAVIFKEKEILGLSISMIVAGADST